MGQERSADVGIHATRDHNVRSVMHTKGKERMCRALHSKQKVRNAVIQCSAPP
jgi:hypothetical protein